MATENEKRSTEPHDASESGSTSPSETSDSAELDELAKSAKKGGKGLRTPGVSESAKAVKTADDLPLNVGPRDALVIDGHNEHDYVPDAEEKGYHVGLVRQPVMAVVENGRVVGFEAVAESKFLSNPGELSSLKAAHNAREAKWRAGRDFRTYQAPASE